MIMTFDQASGTVLPFGKYKDQTLDEIATTDDGLLYLDWLVGKSWLFKDLKEAIDDYLTEGSVARDLELAMEKRKHSR